MTADPRDDVGNVVDRCDSYESPDQDPVDELAEDFIARLRRGESPSITDYAARHPRWASDIERLFPTILVLERARPEEDRPTPEQLPSRGVPDQLGPYRLIRSIGRGGMGWVFEAEHLPLGRRVALKLLPPDIEPDSHRRVRFVRESRAAALLHHSNIVPVFDVGEHDGWCYYAMQLVSGVSLDAVIPVLRDKAAKHEATTHEAAGPPNWPDGLAGRLARSLWTGCWTTPENATDGPESPEGSQQAKGRQGAAEPVMDFAHAQPYWRGIAQTGLQVALALQHAHEHGVLHRDIKPGNLLLDEFGAAWIVDFGLVKFGATNDLTRTGEWLGTLRYLPPETFENIYDARGDVYSLGLTLYELVALEPALGYSTKSQLVAHLVRDEPARLERLRPAVPRDLATIIHKAIERDAERRYASAAELASDLRRFLADRPIHARPVSRWERLTRWRRRHRGLAALMAALAASLILFSAGALVAALTYYRIAGENRRLAEHERELSRQVGTERDSKQTALADMYANYGLEQAEHGNDREALLWFVRAAEASAADSHQRRMNEIRMAAWNRHLARPFRHIPHEDGLVDWRFHPNDRYLLGRSHRSDRSPLIWDVVENRPLPLPAQCGAVVSLAWSTDGERLALGNAKGQVTLCQFPSLEIIESLTAGDRPVTQLAFGPGDAHLAIAADNWLRFWNGERRSFAGEASSRAKRLVDLQFAPDGEHLLATDEDGIVEAFAATNFATTDVREPLWTTQLDWTTQWVKCRPQFDESGRHAIIARPHGRLVWIRLGDGHVTREITHRPGRHAPPYELATNERRTQLAVASLECGVDIYSTADGSVVGSLPSRGDMAVCFSPDGEHLHVGGSHRQAKSWSVDDLIESGAPAVNPTGFLRLVASHDGRLLMTVGYDGDACVWQLPEPATRRLPARRTPAHFRGWFSHDSRYVFVRQDDAALSVHDVQSGRPVGVSIHPPGHLLEGQPSPDGQVVALLACQDEQSFDIGVWNWRTGEPRFPPVRLVGSLVHGLNSGWYLSDQLQFSPDGASVYVLLRKSLTRIDAHTGAIDWQQSLPPGVGRIKISPDGRWAVCQGGPTVEVLATADGQRRPPIPDQALSLAISPDSQFVALGGHEGIVRLWKIESPSVDGPKLSHPSWVEDVQFSADGRLLLTRGKDHGIRIWDRTTGNLMGVPVLMDEPAAATLTADSRFLATATASGIVDVWDARTGKRMVPTRRAPSPFANQVFNDARNLHVSRDNRWLLVGGRAHESFLFRLDLAPPRFPDDLFVQRQWAELLSYSRLNAQGHLVRLTQSEWNDRWRERRQSSESFDGPER